MVEGSVPTAEDGVYCCIGGRSAGQILQEAAAGAKAVVAWGNCACAGCVQAAKPNPTRATPIHQIVSGKPIINVQGCPPIAEVMAGVVVYLLTFDRIPQLDALGRPMAFYSRRVHDTCYRRPYYDAGMFVESFDDENARRGFCLYKMGCRGPTTYNSCGVMRWNNGVSYPIQSGHRLHRLLRGGLLGQRALLPAARQFPRFRHRGDGRRDRPRGRRGHRRGRRRPRGFHQHSQAPRDRRAAGRIRQPRDAARRGRTRRPSQGVNHEHAHRCRSHHPHRGPSAHRGGSRGRPHHRRLERRHDGPGHRDHPQGPRPARRLGLHRAGLRRLHHGPCARVRAVGRGCPGHRRPAERGIDPQPDVLRPVPAGPRGAFLPPACAGLGRRGQRAEGRSRRDVAHRPEHFRLAEELPRSTSTICSSA